MSLLRRFLNRDMRIIGIALQQKSMIRHQQRQLEQQSLEHARSTRDLIEQFLIVQEAGTDVREQLMSGLNDLRDEVARLEEHAPS